MKIKVRNLNQLGFAIRQYRRKSELSQGQLAQLAGVRQPTISDIENGKRAFTDTFLRLINALEIELVFEPVAMGNCIFDPEEFYNG